MVELYLLLLHKVIVELELVNHLLVDIKRKVHIENKLADR
jgi:hypothetical protein